MIEELNRKLPKNLQKQCTECNTSVKYLPVFQFHHESGEKNITWDEIKFLPVDKVKELMLNEALKVLCANCHELVESHQFVRYSVEILGEIKGQLAKKQ